MKTRPSSVKERVKSIIAEKTVKQGGAVEVGVTCRVGNAPTGHAGDPVPWLMVLSQNGFQ